MSRPDALPLGMRPRGLRREEAAAYVRCGVTKFDECVADGRMPKPRMIDGIRSWDILELDAAYSALPHEGEKPAGPWAKVG